MKIEVTQEHIDKGDRFSPSCCPLALAIKDATGLYGVSVGADYVTRMEPYRFITLPRRAAGFRKAFDRAEKVKPFTFELDI